MMRKRMNGLQAAIVSWIFLFFFGYAYAGFYVVPIGQKPKRTVLVSPKSTPVDSGTALLNALAKITTASETNPYLILIEPGIYDLQNSSLIMKPHVHVQGAGQAATVITSTVEANIFLTPHGTITMAADTNLKYLTIRNLAAANTGIALSFPNGGIIRTNVVGVTAIAHGTADHNYGVYSAGWGDGTVEATLQDVQALAENAITDNNGLIIDHETTFILHGGTYVGRGGQYTSGIGIWSSGEPKYTTKLTAYDIIAVGENGTILSHGLLNAHGVARLVGGSFTARGGSETIAIYNVDQEAYTSGTVLYAENVAALAEGGSSTNICLDNYAAEMIVKGSTLTASGGTDAIAISNSLADAELSAIGVQALANGASNFNTGIKNQRLASGQISGGIITGHGGTNARGLYLLDNDPYTAGTLKVSGTLVEALDGAVNSALVIESGVADAFHTALEAADNLILGSGGTVNLRQTHLEGGVINSTGGTVSCLAVTTTASFYENTCP